MKESGIEWVGKIPDRWEVLPNKYIMRKVKRICKKWNGEDVLSLTMKGVVVRDFSTGGKMPKTFDGYQYIHKGELLMCLFDIDVTPRCVGLVQQDGITSPAYSSFELNEDCYAGYYYYYYLMIDNTKELLHLAKNLRHSFTEDQLGTLKTPRPPIDEQKKISDFLDDKCYEIDSLIGDIGKQIGLLEQYKKSIITEVVTKGLNPYVDMKDSGIEWIGLIPKHWEVLRIKNLGTARNGLTYSPTDTVDEEHGTLVLRSSNVQNGRIVLDDNVYVSTRISDELMVRKGDILICSRNGSRELIGKNALIEDVKATYGAFMMVYRCIAPKFMYYVLNSDVFSYYLGSFFTSTINQLTGANFNNMKIVFCPDELERNEITKYLDDKCAAIDEVLSKKHQQIEILTEYKKSLIYEYVTGKKEVS